MSESIPLADLQAIAARINAREAEIIAMTGKSLHLAALIGHDLNRVKASLPSGQFMPWLKANCTVRQAQANRYQRLAREKPEYLDPDRCPHLSINAALELISAPVDVRELVGEAIASGEIVHHKTIRELSGKVPYPDVRTAAKPAVVQPVNAAPRTETWIFVPHACRHCCGRLLIRRVSPKITEVICAKCETRERGAVESLCWCGKEAGTYGRIFECIPNPNKRAELPNAIMVRERPVVMAPPDVRPSRYAGTGIACELI